MRVTGVGLGIAVGASRGAFASSGPGRWRTRKVGRELWRTGRTVSRSWSSMRASKSTSRAASAVRRIDGIPWLGRSRGVTSVTRPA